MISCFTRYLDATAHAEQCLAADVVVHMIAKAQHSFIASLQDERGGMLDARQHKVVQGPARVLDGKHVRIVRQRQQILESVMLEAAQSHIVVFDRENLTDELERGHEHLLVLVGQ